MCLGIVFQAGGVVYVSATPKQPALDTKIYTPRFVNVVLLLSHFRLLHYHSDTTNPV